MTTDEALLAAIAASPDDDLPRLAYCDWLQEQGDEARTALAAFIRYQLELDKSCTACGGPGWVNGRTLCAYCGGAGTMRGWASSHSGADPAGLPESTRAHWRRLAHREWSLWAHHLLSDSSVCPFPRAGTTSCPYGVGLDLPSPRPHPGNPLVTVRRGFPADITLELRDWMEHPIRLVGGILHRSDSSLGAQVLRAYPTVTRVGVTDRRPVRVSLGTGFDAWFWGHASGTRLPTSAHPRCLLPEAVFVRLRPDAARCGEIDYPSEADARTALSQALIALAKDEGVCTDHPQEASDG